MKNAPNPNAARLLQSFMFSVECQQLMVDFGGAALVPCAGEGKGRAQAAEGIKLMKDDPAAVEKRAEDIKARYMANISRCERQCRPG